MKSSGAHKVWIVGPENSGKETLLSATVQVLEQERHVKIRPTEGPSPSPKATGKTGDAGAPEKKSAIRYRVDGRDFLVCVVSEPLLAERVWEPDEEDVVLGVVPPLRACPALAQSALLEYTEQVQGRKQLTLPVAVRAALWTLLRLGDDDIGAIAVEGLDEILSGSLGGSGRLVFHPGLAAPYVVEGIHRESSDRILRILRDVASNAVRREWAGGLGRLSSVLHNHAHAFLALTHDDLFNFLTRTASDSRAFDDLRIRLLGPHRRFDQCLRMETCSVRLCKTGRMDYVEEVLLEDAGLLLQAIEREIGSPRTGTRRTSAERLGRWTRAVGWLCALALPLVVLGATAHLLGIRTFVTLLIAAGLVTLLAWAAFTAIQRRRSAIHSNSKRGWPRLPGLSRSIS